MTFKPGESGNPAGRPKGARNKTTLALEEFLDGEAEAITRKAVEKAMAGDMFAMRLCLERVLAPRKDRAVAFALPPIAGASDAVKASAAIVEAVAAGDLTPSEAGELSKVIDTFARVLDAVEFEARLVRLEQALQGRGSVPEASP